MASQNVQESDALPILMAPNLFFVLIAAQYFIRCGMMTLAFLLVVIFAERKIMMGTVNSEPSIEFKHSAIEVVGDRVDIGRNKPI